ncbi:hypothetical protein [Agromyces protaetiae]|nr:hypothetical protein [Agromyces protaetiae]
MPKQTGTMTRFARKWGEVLTGLAGLLISGGVVISVLASHEAGLFTA